jgi:hypothetical protein
MGCCASVHEDPTVAQDDAAQRDAPPVVSRSKAKTPAVISDGGRARHAAHEQRREYRGACAVLLAATPLSAVLADGGTTVLAQLLDTEEVPAEPRLPLPHAAQTAVENATRSALSEAPTVTADDSWFAPQQATASHELRVCVVRPAGKDVADAPAVGVVTWRDGDDVAGDEASQHPLLSGSDAEWHGRCGLQRSGAAEAADEALADTMGCLGCDLVRCVVTGAGAAHSVVCRRAAAEAADGDDSQDDVTEADSASRPPKDGDNAAAKAQRKQEKRDRKRRREERRADKAQRREQQQQQPNAGAAAPTQAEGAEDEARPAAGAAAVADGDGSDAEGRQRIVVPPIAMAPQRADRGPMLRGGRDGASDDGGDAPPDAPRGRDDDAPASDSLPESTVAEVTPRRTAGEGPIEVVATYRLQVATGTTAGGKAASRQERCAAALAGYRTTRGALFPQRR